MELGLSRGGATWPIPRTTAPSRLQFRKTQIAEATGLDGAAGVLASRVKERTGLAGKSEGLQALAPRFC